MTLVNGSMRLNNVGSSRSEVFLKIGVPVKLVKSLKRLHAEGCNLTKSEPQEAAATGRVPDDCF